MGIPAALKISFHSNESVNYSSTLHFIKMKFAQNNNYKKYTSLGEISFLNGYEKRDVMCLTLPFCDINLLYNGSSCSISEYKIIIILLPHLPLKKERKKGGGGKGGRNHHVHQSFRVLRHTVLSYA